MDRVPTEIRENIIKYLLGPYQTERLSKYVSISKLWQSAFERHMFRSLKITTEELDAFAALFTGPNVYRGTALTSLDVFFVFPSPPNDRGCCPVERIPDREADSVSFSESVAKIFSILADMEKRAVESLKPLILSFHSARRSKYNEESTTRSPCVRKHMRHTKEEVALAKFEHGTFWLREEDKIVPVNQVKRLNAYVFYPEFEDAELAWIPKVVRKLPRVECLLVQANDSYKWGPIKRIARREELAAAVCRVSGDNITHLELSLASDYMYNEDAQPQILLDGAYGYRETWSSLVKQVSTALRNLATLHLHGGLVITPQFFRIIEDESFPSLTELILDFAPATADGRWFYEHDEKAEERSRADPANAEWWGEIDAETSSESDGSTVDSERIVASNSRGNPDEATFFPFLMDAAEAVQCLPCLKKFILKLVQYSWWGGIGYPGENRVFQLWCLKAGTLCTPKGKTINCSRTSIKADGRYIHCNRLYWRVDKWTPWEEVQVAWTRIVGPDAKIVWLDETKWREESRDIFIYEGDF